MGKKKKGGSFGRRGGIKGEKEGEGGGPLLGGEDVLLDFGKGIGWRRGEGSGEQRKMRRGCWEGARLILWGPEGEKSALKILTALRKKEKIAGP